MQNGRRGKIVETGRFVGYEHMDPDDPCSPLVAIFEFNSKFVEDKRWYDPILAAINKLDKLLNGLSRYTQNGGYVLTSKKTRDTPGREPELTNRGRSISGIIEIDQLMDLYEGRGGSGGFTALDEDTYHSLENLASSLDMVHKALDNNELHDDTAVWVRLPEAGIVRTIINKMNLGKYKIDTNATNLVPKN